MTYVDVILPLPLDRVFTYAVPAVLEKCITQYVRVKVPLGISKTYTALVVEVHNRTPKEEIDIKHIIDVIDDSPILLPQQMRLWQWISHYYMASLGDIMQAALPHGMKQTAAYRPRTEVHVRLAKEYESEEMMHRALDMLRRSPKQQEVLATYLDISGLMDGGKINIREVSRDELINASHCTTQHVKALVEKGILRVYDVEVGRLNVSDEGELDNMKPLSDAQQEAYRMLSAKECETPGVTLFHGVTSSGKTEVYIHLIQEALERGEQVMYLLPEIALTVQIMQRLKRVFGNKLGIYHSRYSDNERVEIWKKQLSDEAYDVILGARSSVFLPYKRLGLVIIDEEHETSFKQQDPAPRYHARSVAQIMAHWAGARVILGTATPSIESYFNAMKGKYRLVKLSTRYRDLQLPHIKVVDVKDLRHRKIMQGMLSPDLKSAVAEALSKGEQAIIFHNRRGFSPVIECRQCGWSPKCPNCDVSLTYHKTSSVLTCHYCGYTLTMPKECPDCKNPDLRDRGAGTEKVEDIIMTELSGISQRVARMDLDTTRTKGAYERIISDFANGKTNILIGTQMVTKGLDFDNVSVVGILSADQMLNKPDFRAFEYAFTMMTQVAGRAGRKGRRGQVILQTNQPALPVIRQIATNDYEKFFKQTLEERLYFHYPPFTRLIYVYLKHRDNNVVSSASIELGSRLRAELSDRVLGPDKPVVGRVNNFHIRKIVIKLEVTMPVSTSRQIIKNAVFSMMQDKRFKSLYVYYDVDPM